ncbi:MAG: lipopolysaccharide biosynthesis protein [Paludibacter sp.]|jgi:O-antigen/teichoic acid export membrane protein
MGDNLKQKTLDALTWTTVDRFGQQSVQFIIGLILARLLSPDDYGLFGLVTIFAALSFVLIESGFGQALIRKKDANDTDFNSVFYFNIFVSALLYFILYFSTPAIANFFKQPQLIYIGRVIFISILFNAFYLVPFTKMVKVMNFKTVAKVNLSATILSGSCGVVLAFMHFGVWALVTQQVSFHFFRMIAYYNFVRWRPKRIFSFSVIREFWSFSIHILGTSLLNVVFNNIYILILGKFYQKKEVGYYTYANKLSETFNFTFQQILLGSTFSMFSQIQDDDERFKRVFREFSKKISIITLPVMTVLIAVAYPFIIVLLTNKWAASVPYFQLLCMASLFNPFYSLNMSALNARGNSRGTFIIETIKKSLILLSVFVCFHFGIISLLWGYVIACFISYLISTIYLKREIKIYIKHQIIDILPSLFFGIVIALAAFSLSFILSNLHVLLLCQFFLVIIMYWFIVRKFQPELYKQAIDFIIDKTNTLKKK